MDDYVLDFGLKFYSSLNPRSHIVMIYYRAFKVLSIVMQIASKFKSKLAVEAIYCVLVCPIFEYVSI